MNGKSCSAQSLATVLVFELVDAVLRIRFDYEHRFAEHEHEFFFGTVPESRALI
jgi:hypothetical protein